MYVPWNMPVEALGRIFVFGQPERGEKAIVPDVEGERACDADANGSRGDGDDGGIGDVDGTMSGSSVDSNRVKTALLAVESQYMCQG